MKAIQLLKHGRPEELTLQEVDDPTIQKTTEVKVKLLAASINPIDTKLRSGQYPIENFPIVLGCDGAGVIEETGKDVKYFKKGDEVYFFHGGVGGIQGNYAELKVLDERFIAHKPKSIDFIHAAASPLILLTAWEALFDRARLQKGQTVFVNAGAGGVGHVAIQLAKNAGARICTTVSNDEKAKIVKDLGAELVIDYKAQDVIKTIMDWTNNVGVDVAIDNVGGIETQLAFSAARHYGDVVSLLLPDQTIDWSIARSKNLRFSLEVMLSPLLFNLEEQQRHQTDILKKCAGLFDAGNLKVKVSQTLPLKSVAQAHQTIEDGHTTGKIVLTI